MSVGRSDLVSPSFVRFVPLAVLALALFTPLAAGAQETRLGSELQVNTFTTDSHFSSRVAAAADGDFVVVWTSSNQDGYNAGVFARPFSSAGAALASEFQVNTYTTADQKYPAAAADPDGDFVVVRQGYGQDGAGFTGTTLTNGAVGAGCNRCNAAARALPADTDLG